MKAQAVYNAVVNLAKEYGVRVTLPYGSVYVGKDGMLDLDAHGMPALPFFVDLAAAVGLPLENIHAEIRTEILSNCDTCGPEIEGSVRIEIPAEP